MPRESERAKGEGDPESPLDARVISLMAGFPGSITFAGLRRTLGTHPESLSRALRRLERDGTLVRTEDGYRLSRPEVPPLDGTLSRGWFPRKEDALAVEVRLTSISDAEVILGSLAGRWFGEYRWVGSYEEDDRTLLVWTSSATRQVLTLEIRGGILRVYVRGPARGSLAVDSGAAYELLQHATIALRTPKRLSGPDVLHLSSGREAVPLRDLAG